MRLLVPIIIVAVIFGAGYLMGRYAGSKASTGPKLTRPERKELSELRMLKGVVRSTAAQHSDVYPELARIIQDEVETADRKIDEIKAEA